MLLCGLAGEQPDKRIQAFVKARIGAKRPEPARRWAWRVPGRFNPDRIATGRRRSSRHAMLMGSATLLLARTSRMTTIPRHSFSANDLPSDIGARLRSLREGRGWTRADLAARSGVPRETVSRLEARKRPPLADTVLRLLVILLADQDDVELNEVVPHWPEADAPQVIGHGPRSRVRRRQLDLSAAEVAAAVDVSEATLSRFERDTSATPTLLTTKTDAHGDEVRLLRNKRLARTLRFVDLADHEKFCAAEDWLTWPVCPIDDAAAEDR